MLSAQGDTTDDLIEKAKEINPEGSNREMDMLLSTETRTSLHWEEAVLILLQLHWQQHWKQTCARSIQM